nr:sister chromatid cohesion protein PDS5-like isoform X1 [Tanacetum cinerariifolium]
MILVLEESEDISVEMLKPLLATVKKHNGGVLPIAQKLGEEVLKKYAEKLKPYLMPALTALGDSLDSYTEIVTRVCEGTYGVMIYYNFVFTYSSTTIVLDPYNIISI